MRVVLILAVAISMLIEMKHSHAQGLDQLQMQIAKANHALSNPKLIKQTAQSIQSFLSDPKNKALLSSNSPEVETLARLQTRLILYSRLADDLGDSQCNLDSTQKSVKGQEILESSLHIPAQECSEMSADYLGEHKKVSTLITEMKMIEDHSYVGGYSVDDDGEIVFPWQLTEADRQKHTWKFILPDSSDKLGVKEGKSTQLFDPYGADSSRQLADELYKQSLKDTFKTYIHLQTAFGNEKTNPKKIAHSFCKEKLSFFSRLTGKKKAAHCPPAIEKFAIKEAIKSNTNKQPQSYEAGAQELNEQVSKLNKIVERLKKNSQIEYGYDGKTGDKYIKKAIFVDEKQALADYSAYKKFHSQMVSSGTGLFAATDELNWELGLKQLNPKNFIDSHPLINKHQFKKAVDEAREHTFDHAQELLSIYHSKDPVEDQIKGFLQLNPSASSHVLLNRPEFAKTVCRGLKSLSVDENVDQQLRMVATWGGVIVGGAVAFTGVGAIPMAIVGAIAATPDLAMSYKHFEEASNQRDAAFAERDGNKARLETEKYATAKNELMIAGSLTGAGILFDLHQVMKAGRALNLVESTIRKPSAEVVTTIGGHPVLSKAITFDELFASKELKEEYFEYLQNMYGADRFSRVQFDTIMDQVKKVSDKIPEVKTRLWSTDPIGEAFSIEGKVKTSGRDLNSDVFDNFIKDKSSKFEAASKQLALADEATQAKLIQKTVDDFNEKKKILADKLASATSKNEKINLNKSFYEDMKKDPKIQELLNFLVHKKLKQENTIDILGSKDPDLILSFFSQLKDNARKEFKINNITIPEELLTQIKGLIPDKSTLLADVNMFPVKMIKTNQNKLIPAGAGSVAKYDFVPLSHRFDGVFKGAHLNECVGGNGCYLESLTPERWFTVGLKDVKYYQVLKEGQYLGFVQTIPVKSSTGTKMLSVDYGAAVLNNDIITLGKGGSLVRESMHSELNKALIRQSTKQGISGLTVSSSKAINNSGVIHSIWDSTLRSSPIDVKIASDPLVDKIVLWKKNNPTLKDGASIDAYSGKAILDATEQGHRRLIVTSWDKVDLKKVNLLKIREELRPSFMTYLSKKNDIPPGIMDQVQSSIGKLDEASQNIFMDSVAWKLDVWRPEIFDQFIAKFIKSDEAAQLEMFIKLLEHSKGKVQSEGFWKVINHLLENKKMHFAYELSSTQKTLPKEVWKAISDTLEESDGFINSYAHSFLASQKEWPNSVWEKIPKLLAQEGTSAHVVTQWNYTLKNVEWPASFWKSVPDLLKNPSQNVFRPIANTMGRQDIPKEFWESVPGIIKAQRNFDNPTFIFIASLERQPELPDNVWRAVSESIETMNKSPYTNRFNDFVSAVSSKRKIPAYVWDDIRVALETNPQPTENLLKMLKAHPETPKDLVPK